MSEDEMCIEKDSYCFIEMIYDSKGLTGVDTVGPG
jgi:hypothetical protein